MNSKTIRHAFLSFFEKQQHKIVPSAPIVVKNDPTLMFTNAGMNPFKDYFLGNQAATHKRIADTQKCLRVSGKHNDLEEVGTDGYHHTMFEMLGNWSFGDYFKEEAIEFAWKLLTEEYKIPKENLYVSVFGGDEKEGLKQDLEAVNFWKKWIAEERILFFGKKDNFWEMGDTGPCGPCSEIHVDLRSEDQKKLKEGASLVNAGTPEVMEIWNLVFIQFNRKADGSLEELPAKHIDTGMGFERISMVLQNKTSSYDTDIFKPLIDFISAHTKILYGASYAADAKTDLAMRVMADHIRAIAFAIADGAIPSNTGPGYVIRRILRRAVRYAYSFLNLKEAFLYKLLPVLSENMAAVFPELELQKDFIAKVIREEETAFLKTLEDGLRKLEALDPNRKELDGKLAFELYDTYGFPFDLTQLIARENHWTVDVEGFHEAMSLQKERSRSDAKKEYSDWNILANGSVKFVGYDTLETNQSKLLRWRKVIAKSSTLYQLVFDLSPFYPEGGGQVGDTGIADFEGELIEIIDTVRENDLIIHLTNSLPSKLESHVQLKVNAYRRKLIENNHSATHLLHAALRSVLGKHVQQKGSLVKDDYFRFDFSHFQKMEPEQIQRVEQLVNEKIRENVIREERRQVPIDEAQKAGAMMLFGEKYGEHVRMITFDPSYSIELCGGCHVESTGQIGYFKIISESAIAAGIRRIEAVSAWKAEELINQQFKTLDQLRQLLKNPKDLTESIQNLLDENKSLEKQIQELKEIQAQSLKQGFIESMKQVNGRYYLVLKIPLDDSKLIKNLMYQMGQEREPAILFFGFIEKDKPQLMCYVSESITKEISASQLIKDTASLIEGGGGGQAFFATAGGKKKEGLDKALQQAETLIKGLH